MVCRMSLAAILLTIAIFLGSPAIVRELRRIFVSIASELKTAKDEIAALKVATSQPAPVDLSGVADQINNLSQRIDALQALVGTSDELGATA